MHQGVATDSTTSNLLRRALQVNGVFSSLSGLVLIAASDRIDALLGIEAPLRPTGVLLLIFAASLFQNARRQIINRTEAWVAVGLDVAWVIGTTALVFAGVFSSAGNRIVAIVAAVVLVFAVAQFAGLRKLSRRNAA